MPTTATDYTQTAQETTLKTIRQGQQAIVEGVRAWASAAEKAIPETPAIIPFSDDLPNPNELVQSSFKFAEQLLKAQREFAENILEAAAPVLTKPAGKTATKA
jgi:hypothetical protein